MATLLIVTGTRAHYVAGRVRFGPMRAIVLYGEELRLEERPDPVPGSSEVVVAAPYAALNPADLLQRAGRYPAPPGAPQDIPGLEVSGRVVACGAAVLGWQVGARVFGLVG